MYLIPFYLGKIQNFITEKAFPWFFIPNNKDKGYLICRVLLQDRNSLLIDKGVHGIGIKGDKGNDFSLFRLDERT